MSPKLEALADAIAPLVAERVADRLADMLAEREQDVRELVRTQVLTGAPEPLIDAAEAARRLSVSRDTVYALADELGARRVGTGPRPRLKFDPARVAAYGSTEQPKGSDWTAGGPFRSEQANATRRTSRRREGSTAPLLPVKGETP